jgi:hypothetical protein
MITVDVNRSFIIENEDLCLDDLSSSINAKHRTTNQLTAKRKKKEVRSCPTIVSCVTKSLISERCHCSFDGIIHSIESILVFTSS